MSYTVARRTVGQHRDYPYHKLIDGQLRNFAVEAILMGEPPSRQAPDTLIETLLDRARIRQDGRAESSVHGIRVVLQL